MTLYVVSSNMPGCLPNDDDPFIGHADADTLVSVLADLIMRDGEHSIESIMASGSDVYDSEDQMLEDSAGDSGMVELWQSGHEAYREALRDVREALARNEEFVYSYSIDWNDTPSGMVYFIQAADAEHCSDETCEECTEEIMK